MSLPPFFRRPTEKIIGSRRSSLDMARGRLVFMGFVFALAYILIAARVMDLTIIQGELPKFAAGMAQDSSPEIQVAEKSVRSDITDRNGVLLARSLNTASLSANPKLIPDKDIVARDIARIFPDMSYADILKKLQGDGSFVWIKRNLTPAQQSAILEAGHPGLQFSTEARRVYPQGALSAHIVGLSDIDGKGLAGIERNFDAPLKDGKRTIQLTLDIRLQHIMRRELQSAIREFRATGGAGAIMDVNTGEILAAVSLPDFDPNDIRKEDRKNMFNRLTQGVYEMGSTFKIFSTAAFIELRNPSMGQTFDARDPIKIGKFSIRDFHPENRHLTIPEIFMHSSNIGAARMAESIGTDALKNFYSDLGLMDQVPIDIREVGSPLIPNPWYPIDTLVASYGHSMAVTPIQTISAVASIVNGGILVRPLLVLDPLQEREKKRAQSDVRVVSAETSHRMRQLMRLVVTEGTAKSADVPGFQVGGKTGTAQKHEGKGYNADKRLSSFIGMFPSNAPRYAVMIMVDEPKATKATYGYATGGWVAAPAAARVIRAMVPVLGLVPEDTEAAKDMSDPLIPYIKTKTEKHLVAAGVE